MKKMLPYEMKFLVPNYSCLQNHWLGGYRPQIPVLSVLCPQLNLLNPALKKIPGYATGTVHFRVALIIRRSISTLRVTFCRLHIIFIAFRPAINAIIITYIITQYQCTNTLGILCITAVQAIHACSQKLNTALLTQTFAVNLSDSECQIQPKDSD